SFSEPDSSSSSLVESSSQPEPDSSSSVSIPEPSSESSSESVSASCSYEFNTYGRKQIGVNQAGAGAFYPFVSPSDNLEYLIADLFIHYIDDKGIFEPPFKIDWLVGFGCLPNSSPVGQTHAYDMQISDNKGQVVFNSQFASTF